LRIIGSRYARNFDHLAGDVFTRWLDASLHNWAAVEVADRKPGLRIWKPDL
jgi:hypothetical protein